MPEISTDVTLDASANAQNVNQNPSAVETFLEGKIAHRFCVKLKTHLKKMYDAVTQFDMTDASYGRFLPSKAEDFNTSKGELERYLGDAADSLVYDATSKKLHVTAYTLDNKELESAALTLDYLQVGTTSVSDSNYVSEVKVTNINADIKILNKFLSSVHVEVLASADAQNQELLDNPILFGYGN